MVQLSAGNIIATIFWDAKGILLIANLARRHIIVGQYYAILMNHISREAPKQLCLLLFVAAGKDIHSSFSTTTSTISTDEEV